MDPEAMQAEQFRGHLRWSPRTAELSTACGLLHAAPAHHTRTSARFSGWIGRSIMKGVRGCGSRGQGTEVSRL